MEVVEMYTGMNNLLGGSDTIIYLVVLFIV